jgi:hypothetical protein
VHNGIRLLTIACASEACLNFANNDTIQYTFGSPNTPGRRR